MADAEESKEEPSNLTAEEQFELQKKNCIFCKIATKEIPSKVLHETDKLICVLDINPASEGHILVFPKEHYMILPHVPDELQSELFKAAKLMSKTLLSTLQARGTTIFVANGAAAGQRAPHVLIHVFPRKEGDGLLALNKVSINEEQSAKLKAEISPILKRLFGKGLSEPAVKNATFELVDDSKDGSNVQVENSHVDKHDEDQHIRTAKTKVEKTEMDDKPKKKTAEKTVKKPVDLDDISKLFGA